MVNMFFLKDVKKTADCGSVFEPKQDEEYLCYDDTIQMPQSPQEGYTDYVNTNSETDTENTERLYSQRRPKQRTWITLDCYLSHRGWERRIF